MFGLIGYPLGHSFSAKYFNGKFKNEGINNSYCLFPLNSIEELNTLLQSETALEGLNVTIPYKEKIIPYLDSISPDAQSIGAVNVVKITRFNERIPYLSGYNTDWKGFSLSLEPMLSDQITSALVLGTGGASKAVVYALNKLGIKTQLVSRSRRKECITYADLTEELIRKNLLIVNTTPLGMFPDIETFPDIPYQYLTPEHICYDLVYNPTETEFMKRATNAGAKAKNGLEMLYRQAELSWEIWNGH